MAPGRSVIMRHLSLKLLKSSPSMQGAGLLLLSLGLGCGSPAAAGSGDDSNGSGDGGLSTGEGGGSLSTAEGGGSLSTAEGSADRGTVTPVSSREAGLDSSARPPIDGDAAAPAADAGGSVGDAGSTALGRTSIAWAWILLSDTLAAIRPNAASFTHVSPLVYDVNFAYTSGVAEFWNTPGGADLFQNGLTSITITQQIHAMGLKSLPVIMGGAANNGTDAGIHTILTDPTVQASFISSMVTEATTKNYDGYNLDWEMSQSQTTFATYGTELISFLDSFKSALHAAGMILTYDVVDFNVLQSNCSGGIGPVDLTQLGPVVDLAIVEDYNSTFGTASNACPATLPDPLLCNQTFMDDLNFMCAYLPANVVSIGMNACSTTVPSCGGGTNTIAPEALSAIETYGIKSVAIFPQGNSDGPSNGYAIYDPNGITPTGTTWFSLLSGFLSY
jgi:hypothetical protein